MKKAKKKSNAHLHAIEFGKTAEKDRNLSILSQLTKEKDYAAGKKIGGPVQDDKKAMKNYKMKDEKQRQAMNRQSK